MKLDEIHHERCESSSRGRHSELQGAQADWINEVRWSCMVSGFSAVKNFTLPVFGLPLENIEVNYHIKKILP